LGYITSQVSAPAQDLSAGVLLIDVNMGTIGSSNSGDSPLSPAGLALAHQSGDVLNLRDLEQTLENLRRIPQAKVNLDIKPGTEPGTSDIDIQFQPSKPVRLNLSLDDGGGRSTGQWQGSATMHWDNPSGNADLFYVSLSPTVAGKEAGPRGSRSQVVHYSLPIGYWNIGLTGTRSAYHQTIAGAFQSYVYSGQSDQTDVQLGRVLRRDGLSKTQASLKAFSRGSSNFIDDTEVEVQRRRTAGWELSLSHLHYIGAGVLDLQWLYRRGTGAFGAMPAPEELFAEGTSRMKLMQISATWQQPFSVAERAWRYVGHWRLQHNQTPLTPQDKFCAGGRHTVRGFDGKQSACADRGFLWRNEFSTSLGEGKPQLYLALDHARLHRSAEQVPQTLTGAAVGLRHGWPLWGGSASVDAFVAQPVRKPEHIRTAKTTTGIQFHWAF
jgi:hemolysin activation/secretion protein